MFQYLSEKGYIHPGHDTFKRMTRKKAAMVVIREGVMVVEVQFVKSRREQLKILETCHYDPTAGHMREKKAIARITERFIWSK